MSERDDGFDFTEDDGPITDVRGVALAVAPDTARGGRVLPRAQLTLVTGDDVGRAFPIATETTLIGRDAGATVHLDVTDVSRRHAQIAWRDGAFIVEDLASANGTFVNGELVRGPIALRFGDRVQVGASAILIMGPHDDLSMRASQLQRVRVMEAAVGELASEFADAFMVIQGGLQDLEGHVPSGDDETREVFDDLKDAVAVAGRLADRLLELHRPADVGKELVDLDAVTNAALIEANLPDTIAIVVEIDAGAIVRGARVALAEMLGALLDNARDAMPAGGTLRIAIRVVAITQDEAVARLLRRGGAYVEIAITDSGHGMNAATLMRAFEPYFTTRTRGPGTGLGLSAVDTTARRHGGGVAAESAVGVGTTVRVWLPSGDEPTRQG